MELWIRSQDKIYLNKIEGLMIFEKDNGECDICRGILTYGTYKSKKRALEVLDEIQSILQPKITYIQKEPVETIEQGLYQLRQEAEMKIQEINTYVYEMPEE